MLKLVSFDVLAGQPTKEDQFGFEIEVTNLAPNEEDHLSQFPSLVTIVGFVNKKFYYLQ